MYQGKILVLRLFN